MGIAKTISQSQVILQSHRLGSVSLNPSRSKDFYNLVRPKGVKLPPHVNRYNFVGFEDFLTKLWGHLDKSNTQIWDVKYF